MKTKVFVSLIVGILFVAMIGYAKAVAVTETFTVPPFQAVVRTLGLSEGDKVSGFVAVSGGIDDDIDLCVTDPNGNTILRFDRATHKSFSFTASTTGTYTLHFDNSFSIISSKSVTLSYTISKPTFGLTPQRLFYLLISLIVIIIIPIIAAYVLKTGQPLTQPQG